MTTSHSDLGPCPYDGRCMNPNCQQQSNSATENDNKPSSENAFSPDERGA